MWSEFCRNCGERIDVNIERCPSCGSVIEPPQVDIEAERPRRRYGCFSLVALIVVLCIVSLTLIPVLTDIFRGTEPPVLEKTETDEYFDVRYEWSYEGSRWECKVRVPKSEYEFLSSKQRTASYREYVLNSIDDEWMKNIANLLSDLAAQKRWDQWGTVSFVLSFVQSMPYTSDKVTTGYDEYPRYPVETVVDGGGDCEDTSILFASIVRQMGHGVVLLTLTEDEHMAAGVKISSDLPDNWSRRYPLTYYTAEDGEVYAYCETTGRGWELGQKPDDIKGSTAQIINVF